MAGKGGDAESRGTAARPSRPAIAGAFFRGLGLGLGVGVGFAVGALLLYIFWGVALAERQIMQVHAEATVVAQQRAQATPTGQRGTTSASAPPPPSATVTTEAPRVQ